MPKGGQWGTPRINEFRYERYIRGGLLNIDNVVVVVILVGTISLKKDLRGRDAPLDGKIFSTIYRVVRKLE